MARSAAQPKFLRVLLSVITLVSVTLTLFPSTAYAWKPSTHIYFAEEALKDALDDGKVTIYRVNYETGEVLDKLGDYSVDASLLAALQAHPEQFRAGVLGPDAYPDILVGQQAVHPDVSVPSGSNSWLEYLWRAAANEGAPVKAFVAGYLTHASGDMFGHTFVNNYTGGEFELGENAIKHVVVEGYVGKRTPQTLSATNEVVTEEDVSIEGVEEFIYRYMVDARPGSMLKQQLLTGSTSMFTVPSSFSMLRTELQQEIAGYYRTKAEYDRRIDQKLEEADNCDWDDFSCSARALEAQAGFLAGEKLAYMAANGPSITYMEHWVDDIDSGLRAWPRFSHDIAKLLVYNSEGAQLTEAQEVAKNYINDHLLSMSGAPDAVGGTLSVVDDVMRKIRFIQDAIKEMKKDLLIYLVETATGIDDIEKFLKSPEHHFDEVMGAGSEGELTNLAKFNQEVLKIADTGYQNLDERFDYKQLPAAYNTVTINKLILLSQSEINRLLADLGSTQTLAAPNVMLGFLRSLDGDNQWHEHDQKLVFAWDCQSYRQLFMRQVGESGECTLAAESSAPAIERASGTIYTVAGSGSNGFDGDGGPATSARMYPRHVAVDGAGNLYITDQDNQRIRKVDTNGVISTVAGNGNAEFSGDGGLAIAAGLFYPTSVAVDSAGNLYIADRLNHRIRKVDTNGTISTVAGNGNAEFSGDGGPAIAAGLNYPGGVVVDGAGNLYIADGDNHRIRKVDTNGVISTVAGNGTISTIAGNGTIGFNGDGGPAIDVSLSYPESIAVDGAGNIYIVDSSNSRVRKVDATGTISTVAGNGSVQFSGDGGPATSAGFDPLGIAVDGSGNLYIADRYNNRIRKVDTNGTISTVAGNGDDEFSGDGGPATAAGLNYPGGVAVDGAGNLYIVDDNYRIRRVEH